MKRQTPKFGVAELPHMPGPIRGDGRHRRRMEFAFRPSTGRMRERPGISQTPVSRSPGLSIPMPAIASAASLRRLAIQPV